jgi:hypothetical protein
MQNGTVKRQFEDKEAEIAPATSTIAKLRAESEEFTADSKTSDIITQKICADRLHICTATLRALCKKGVIPSIILPGSRLIRFSWSSVQQALWSNQRRAE